ncbi:MAG TPA: hypothetical protein VHB51_00460 [Candidatus Saccharimonadales bacterium]|nr:hypothetical protein [Candidatus Saccharimonadales bacterium]
MSWFRRSPETREDIEPAAGLPVPMLVDVPGPGDAVEPKSTFTAAHDWLGVHREALEMLVEDMADIDGLFDPEIFDTAASQAFASIYGTTPTVNRLHRRGMQNGNLQNVYDMIHGASQFTIDNEPDEIRPIIEDLFQISRGPVHDAAVDNLTQTTVELQPLVRRIDQSARELADQVDLIVSDSPEMAYDLLKMLASFNENREEEVPQPEATFTLGLHIEAVNHGEANILSRLIEAATSGEFDEYIRHDLLVAAVASHGPTETETQKLWRLTRRLLRDVPVEEQMQRLESASADWPDDVKAEIIFARGILVDRLKAEQAAAQQIVEDIRITKLTPEAARKKVDDAAKYIINLVSEVPPSMLARGVKVQRVISEVERRQRRKTRPVVQPEPEVEVPAQAEAAEANQEQEREKRFHVRYLAMNTGETAERGTPEFDAWIADFLRGFKGNKDLITDLKNTFDWIEYEMDLSKSPLDGLEPLGIIMVQGKPHTAYRIKPSHVTGLSLRSRKIIERHRLVVVKPEGEDIIDLIKIVHRDKLDQFERSVSVRSKAGVRY